MFNRILCPTDLSEQSILGISKGVQLAQLCKAELILLNVRPDFMNREEMVMLRISSYDFLKKESDIAESAKAIMKEELRRAGGDHIPHQFILREGEAHKEILNVAEDLDCDLIVITTTGRNHLMEYIKGSHAEQMIHVSHVPMLVFPVPSDEEGE